MVHQYKLSGYNIVLDVDSGSVHLVDDLVYEIISLYGKAGVDSIVQALSDRFDSGEIRSAFGDVRALAEEGKLFSSADHEKRLYQGDREEVIKALCLNVAHTCNLNCSYCFAGQGRYKGGEALMSPETGRRAIDFLIERSGSRRNLEVDFFGGEPLL
ncbi:MAG TPA: 4Fe-4S cluster-binding domain-containing protein, partial [Bacillota bacterium]|nr:4Fe-4S cluster-binding domain-containing protein [Bacillota bacterium]